LAPLDRPLRILVSEGSSLSAREAITALGKAGCQIEVCDPSGLCLARFSRFVRRVHRCPHFASDPRAYYGFIRELLASGHYDVLYPAHEQAYLFARQRNSLSALAGVPVPSFDAITHVQGKVAMAATLKRLGIPTPPTEVVHDEIAARRAVSRVGCPCYVKADIGTASGALWRVTDAPSLDQALSGLRALGAFASGAVVQGLARGMLERIYALAERGHLVAAHCVQQISAGPRGGDVQKVSVDRPAVRSHVARLVEALDWHGALSIDYLRDGSDGSERFVDVNPRLAEPGNAVLCGLDLPTLLVRLGLGDKIGDQPQGKIGVRTHMALQAIILPATRDGSRFEILRTIAALILGRGAFRGSRESLSPVWLDPPSVLPVLFVALLLLTSPAKWRWLAARQVGSYALTDEAARAIREMPAEAVG
jgi:predicted ATP-grasp superfamily ATP-dependent carboligase